MTLPKALSCRMLYFCTNVITTLDPPLEEEAKQVSWEEHIHVHTQPPDSVSHCVTHLLQAFMNEVTYVVDTPS